MKTSVFKFLLFTFCALSYATAFAQSEKLTISVSGGFQHEDFNWSIASDTVNILSELRWRDLKGPQFNGEVQWNAWKAFSISANFSQSNITSGTVTDRDYEQNNRTNKVFDGTFDSDKGTITAIGAHIGYTFFKEKKFSITTAIGYAVNRQSLYLLDRDGNTSNQLKSTYKTNWQGWSSAISGKLRLGDKVILEPSCIYRQLDYDSEANWNLILEFRHPVSFEHTAKGFSITPGMKAAYLLSTWMIFVYGNYSYWNTGNGVDTLYLQNGQVVYSHLNNINRYGYALGIGMSKSF